MSGDFVIVSLPKAGRTWLRLMIGRALQQHFCLEPDDSLIFLDRMSDRDRRIPRIYAVHDGIGPWRDPRDFFGRRVIILVRDPRDLIVSDYYELRFRHAEFDGTLEEFVGDPERVANVLKFYEVWSSGVQELRDQLVVRYEDLHADPHGELRRVLDFVGVDDVSDEVILGAVNFARFDNMRNYEREGIFNADSLRPGSPDEPASFKTRRGVVGGYRDELPPALADELDRAVAVSRAARFGYS